MQYSKIIEVLIDEVSFDFSHSEQHHYESFNKEENKL